MFDFHMHSRVSFDGHDTGLSMARAAADAGLKEICFTDHIDYDPFGTMGNMAFDTAAYNAEYDSLEVPGLKIETESERAEWLGGEKRYELRKKRREEGY